MPISYDLDVPYTHFNGILSMLFRWRGSLWKAVLFPLCFWLIAYYCIFCIYYFLLRSYDKLIFDKVVDVLEHRIDTFIPMTFILGFFVSSMLGRWQKCLQNMCWIDGTAVALTTYIRGSDDETRIMRRRIIRYLVLSQTYVLRNVSVQVQKRFPSLNEIEEANLINSEERALLEETKDSYSQFWVPIIWAEEILFEARKQGKISSDFIAEKMALHIDDFRSQLQNLLKFARFPIPLVYPQLVAFCVRLYFFICLFTRQIIKSNDAGLPESPFFWFPLPTIIEFVVYMGWLKVAEDMLHPLGQEFDNLECNYIIDKNLITGLSLVDKGGKAIPSAQKDAFWDNLNISPYKRFTKSHKTVLPMKEFIEDKNFVKNRKEAFMIPSNLNLNNLLTEDMQHSIPQKADVKILKEKEIQKNYDDVNKKSINDDLSKMDAKVPLLDEN